MGCGISKTKPMETKADSSVVKGIVVPFYVKMSVCPKKFTKYDTQQNDQICVKTNSTTFCCAPKKEVNDTCFASPIMKTLLLQFWEISSISVEKPHAIASFLKSFQIMNVCVGRTVL